ncbi:hypothetical protein HS048_34670 [Planomonospora sp. ID91781]|uniref:hypothetical protein n=1 Tax=Planomonospora sp. ID91781 TaxID=2738135 RepID=UPI0018C3A01F|nr:hypothetical protein [Planomonospora sp. ID91781]MBG0825830.1 hypothetical protein [Planomonospora sp. ID91781]
MDYAAGCPRCGVQAKEDCRRDDGRPRVIPHVKRLALIIAHHLLAYAVPADRATAAVQDALLLLQAQAALKAHQSPGGTEQESEILLRAACLQLHVQSALSAVNGRTLTVREQMEQAGELYEMLVTTRRTAELLHGDQIQPPHAIIEPPTVQQVRRWQELAFNDELRHRTKNRETIAISAQDPQLAPARWRIICHEPNGYFEALHRDEHGLLGPVYRGWVPVPEAVPEVLRRWSAPATRPIEVTWECTPAWPQALLPYGGWLPDHHNNDPDHVRTAGIRGAEVWQDNAEAHRERFADMMHQLRQRWPHEQSGITAFLKQEAARLNADQPQASSLPSHLTSASHRRDGSLVGLGYTVTAGWIAPITVANTGTRQWNDFANHRPKTVPAMAEALLSGDLEHALEVWSLLTAPISVVRVHGPAGPLYHLGSNGAHRLHAARLLGLPAVWTEIRQDALPLQVTFSDVTPYGARRIAADVLTPCWRGLLERGLAAGRFDDAPISAALHLDTVMAPWMLAMPDCAVTWAAAYDRAYPGALNQAGVPTSAWQDPQAWLSWLDTGKTPSS